MLALFALLLPAPLFDVPTLRGAQVGLYAIRAQSGAPLASRDADAEMVPASTFKLLVGSAALDTLGPAFAFTTTFERDGSTLYVRGGGDPLLDASAIAGAARAVTDAGTSTFDALVGDAGAGSGPRYPDGWQVDDLAYDYAAPPSALSFDENAVQLHVAPTAAGSAATVASLPAQAVLNIRNQAVTGAAGSPDTVAARIAWDATDTIVIDGSIPAGSPPDDFGVSVLDAPQFALSMIDGALAAHGIAFSGPPRIGAPPQSAQTVWTHRSEPLPDLLRDMWQPSDNLLAESLEDALGIDRERAWLASAGVDPATVTIADGSGLSAYDRVTPRDLVAVLAHDWNGPYRRTVLAALPVAGRSGTLKDAFTGTALDGKLIAKTGTVNHTRTLAGYLPGAHGTIVFALLINGWMDTGPGATQRLRAFQASVLRALTQEEETGNAAGADRHDRGARRAHAAHDGRRRLSRDARDNERSGKRPV